MVQAVLFTVWFINAAYVFLSVHIGYFLMVNVGLLAGGGYVNNFYRILNSDKINFEYKETAMSLAAVSNNIGIVSSSLISLILDNTVFKE